MPSDLDIIQATEQEIPRITEIQFSAFEGDPYQEALYPGEYYSPALRQSANERTLRHWDADPTARWMLCQDRKSHTILGFALWNVYDTERPESEWMRPPEVDWCSGRKWEIAMNFLSMNQRLRERIWGGRPYVLLNLLCIQQDHQRQGAGTALVRWGMALADSLGLSIHLEASAAGYQLYRKLGFHQVDQAVVKAEEWDGDHDRTYIAMVKEPHTAEQGG